MMKTEIVIAKGWEVIEEYSFPLTLTINDVVVHEGREYRVNSCILDLDESKITILLK